LIVNPSLKEYSFVFIFCVVLCYLALAIHPAGCFDPCLDLISGLGWQQIMRISAVN
jgi:hypothetical protein